MTERTKQAGHNEQPRRGFSRLEKLIIAGTVALSLGIVCIINKIRVNIDMQPRKEGVLRVVPKGQYMRHSSFLPRSLEDSDSLNDSPKSTEVKDFSDAGNALLRIANSRPELIYNALIDFLRFFHGELSDPVDLEYLAVFGVDGFHPDVGLAYLESCSGDLQDFTKVLQIAIGSGDTRVATIVAAYIKRECYKERRENEDRIIEESLADGRVCDEEGGFRSPREECEGPIREMQNEIQVRCQDALPKADAPYEEQIAGTANFTACISGAIDDADRQVRERCAGLSEESPYARCSRENEERFGRATVDAEKVDKKACGERIADKLGVNYNAVFDLYAKRRANEFFELYSKFSVLETLPEVADLEQYIRLIQLIHNVIYSDKTIQQFIFNALGVADKEAFRQKYIVDVIVFLSWHYQDAYCREAQDALENYGSFI